MNPYEQKYAEEPCYWGPNPSLLCLKVLQMMPPEGTVKLLDIGCGEGRNAVFLARNGYHVTAFDSATTGVEKTKRYAEQAGVRINVFQADLNEYRLQEKFDVIFSTGVLQYIVPDLREQLLENYKAFTSTGGLNVHSVFVKKPFILRAPDAEDTAHLWKSGELFTLYHDWKIEFCEETIFDCNSAGVPHKHAVNRLIARKPTDSE